MLFISYSHKDNTFVDELKKRLEQSNMEFWYDRLALPKKNGHKVKAKIVARIAQGCDSPECPLLRGNLTVALSLCLT